MQNDINVFYSHNYFFYIHGIFLENNNRKKLKFIKFIHNFRKTKYEENL